MKVTRSFIATELSVINAHRFFELMAKGTISDDGIFILEGAVLPEALSIIDDQKAIAEARETYRLSQPMKQR